MLLKTQSVLVGDSVWLPVTSAQIRESSEMTVEVSKSTALPPPRGTEGRRPNLMRNEKSYLLCLARGLVLMAGELRRYSGSLRRKQLVRTGDERPVAY